MGLFDVLASHSLDAAVADGFGPAIRQTVHDATNWATNWAGRAAPSNQAPPGPSWWESNRASVAVFVSVVAILLSASTLAWAVRQLRLNNFARLHEALVDPQAASGRKALSVAHSTGSMPGLEDGRWDQINHALTLYDTLGLYYTSGLVRRRLVRKAWRHQITAIEPDAASFLEHRRNLGIDQPMTSWPDLVAAVKST